jgi:hypothetical protein
MGRTPYKLYYYLGIDQKARSRSRKSVLLILSGKMRCVAAR